jgi:hypothetical protein
MRILRRSSLIQSWSGLVPLERGGTSVMLTWTPAPAAGRRPAVVMMTASAADGQVLFDGPVSPVGGRSEDAAVPDHAAFEAPPGPIRVDMKILDGKGLVLDTDARDVSVPQRKGTAAVIYAPGVLRARSGREFRELSENPLAPPVPTRDFRRTDRLIVRTTAVDASGSPAPIAATLLNRWRQPMRTIEAMPTAPAGATQFDLPLSALAPGEYTLRLTVASPQGSATEHVTFKVQG